MKKILALLLILLMIAFQGCAAKEESTVASKETANEEVATMAPTEEPAATPTVAPTEAPAPTVEPSPTPVPEGLVLPITKNETGKVLIQTVSQAQDNLYTANIISSPNGENAVIDPYKMPRKKVLNINPVAIANTHLHPDHIDNMFNNDYKQAQLMSIKIGEIQTEDFHIYNIRASHTEDPIVDTVSTDYFVVFEVGGLRIAHLGDCGQTELTKEQLEQLGEIDIAFTQFDNPAYSNMTLENEKGFKLIEQLNPRIFIPTHYSEYSVSKMEEKYGEITRVENMLAISKEDLPEGTMNPYIISNDHKYK